MDPNDAVLWVTRPSPSRLLRTDDPGWSPQKARLYAARLLGEVANRLCNPPLSLARELTERLADNPSVEAEAMPVRRAIYAYVRERRTGWALDGDLAAAGAAADAMLLSIRAVVWGVRQQVGSVVATSEGLSESLPPVDPNDWQARDARRSALDAMLDARLASHLHDLLGNPFRPVTFIPSWRSATAVALAEAIYAGRAFDRLPILADALEEAGCDSVDVLAHCRGDGPHARGCWVVDMVLGKA